MILNAPREQKLVDIMFEMVYRVTQDHRDWKPTRDEAMEWVAYNLKECGFPTTPMGISWGVLIVSEPSSEQKSRNRRLGY